MLGLPVILPPKTDRKANGKRPDVMPTSRRNELLKDAFSIHSIPELRTFDIKLWLPRNIIYLTCNSIAPLFPAEFNSLPGLKLLVIRVITLG